MGHAHGHSHSHSGLDARRAGNRSRMAVALAINSALLVATVVGGLLTGSLALLADAGHLLSDVGAIAIGLVAARLAARAPTPARTFGLQRSEVLGALANGILLVVIAVLIVVEALGRFGSAPDVSGGGMLAVGIAGLAGNIAATWVLASGDRDDLNLEGVLRHSAADALSSVGVVVAAILILTVGWEEADPRREPRHRGADPRRLLAAAEGARGRAARGCPGGNGRVGGRQCDGRRPRRRRGARPARLDGDVGVPRAQRPRRGAARVRPRPRPAPGRERAARALRRSRTRRFRWSSTLPARA